MSGAELALTATAKAEAADALKRLSGGFITECSALAGDYVRERRFYNQVQILQRAMQHLKDKGISPRQVSLKTLCPLLNYSALEEDESMKRKWEKLLANAADPNFKLADRPDFVQALNELTPKESAILDKLYHFSIIEKQLRVEHLGDWGLEQCDFAEIISDLAEYRLAGDNLTRLRLATYPTTNFNNIISGVRSMGGGQGTWIGKLCLTTYGTAFVETCK